MAFDLESFVNQQTKKSAGAFDVDAFLIKQGVQPKPDLGSAEGLAAYAKSQGFETEVNQILDGGPPKLSFLQRLGKGLGVLNPAEAILTGQEKGIGAGLAKFATGIGTGLASALTGRDYEGERRTFSDVAAKMGVENGIAKFGIGLVGDILLDPSTYFGGAIAKGIGIGAKATGNVALKGIAAVAPESAEALRVAGDAVGDAFGAAFNVYHKTQKGAVEDVLTFLNKEQRAKMGLAASNLDRLGTGVMTQAQREELALKMIAGKRAEFVAREAGQGMDEAAEAARKAAQSADPVVQQAIEAQSARGHKFADNLDLENPYETYFPFIKKEKVEKFVDETKGLRVGSEGYRKQFRNLLTNENLELDPAKAFFTREAQVVSDKMTRDFLGGFVSKYGKALDSFKSADDAAKAGFELIKEKGMFGKELGYVPKWDAKVIKNLITPEFQTVNMLAKATGFDAITNLFKRSVTGLFAPFHVRNFASGMIQNFEVLGKDALSPKNIALGQKIAYYTARGRAPTMGALQVAGKPTSAKKVVQAFADRFGGDSFYTKDFVTALDRGQELKSAAKLISKDSFKETVKTVGLGQEAIPFRVARAIGQFIEHQQKATAYVTALGQGKNIDEALKLAERSGFDYGALTKFESQIMRRIVPFYSFTRKNIELQLRTLGTHPERINQVLAFFSNTSNLAGGEISPEERENLPDFIKAALGVKLQDTPEGLKQYISNFGTPIEAFSDLFNRNPVLKAISMMNPLLKTPTEIGIGKDSFREKDLKEVYDAREYKGAPQIIKDLLDIHEVQKDVLDKNELGKLVKVGERTQYVADPVRLLIARSLFTSRGASYLDQVFGNDLQGFSKFLKTTTGIKPQTVDLEMQKGIKERDQKRELEDLLIREGKVKSFQRTYIPKE